LGIAGWKEKYCLAEKHAGIKECIAEDKRRARSWWGSLIDYQEEDFNYCLICGLYLGYESK